MDVFQLQQYQVFIYKKDLGHEGLFTERVKLSPQVLDEMSWNLADDSFGDDISHVDGVRVGLDVDVVDEGWREEVQGQLTAECLELITDLSSELVEVHQTIVGGHAVSLLDIETVIVHIDEKLGLVR